MLDLRDFPSLLKCIWLYDRLANAYNTLENDANTSSGTKPVHRLRLSPDSSLKFSPSTFYFRVYELTLF
jgi:hypothetical protein